MKKIDDMFSKKKMWEIQILLNEMVKKSFEITTGIQMLKGRKREIQKRLSSINLESHDRRFKKVVSLKQGEGFGELALISKKGIRNARVAAESPVTLGVLKKDDYNATLVKIEKQRLEHYCSFLQSISYFKSLTKANILRIVTSINTKKYYRGQVVTTEQFESEEPEQDSDLEGSDNGKPNEKDQFVNFVLNGEFAAMLSMKIRDKAQDPII